MNLVVFLSDFVLFPYCVLLEQSTRIVEKCRLVGGAWVLIGIVVTTCYRGENIDQLTSPLHHITIDTFLDMAKANLSIFSPNVFHAGLGRVATTQNHWDNRLNVTSKNYAALNAFKTKITNYILNSVKITYQKFFDLLTKKEFDVLYYPLYHWAVSFAFGNSTVENARKADDYLKNLTIPATLQGSINISSDSEYFMKRLRECNPEVYVDTYQEIYRMRQKLKREFSDKLQQIKDGTLKSVNKAAYDPQRIVMSKDRLVSIGKSFITFRVPWPYEVLTRRVLALSESGLSTLWHNWENRILVWNDTVQFAQNFDPVKGLSLKDNTVVIFILYFIFIPALPLLILVVYELNIFKILVNSFPKLVRKTIRHIGMPCFKMKATVIRIEIKSVAQKC